jgi:hypothetical protein
MTDIEDVLRNFRPAPEPEGFWDRVLEGKPPLARPGPRHHRAWKVALAAAALCALTLTIVTAALRNPAPIGPQEAFRRIREAVVNSETACIKFAIDPDPGSPEATAGSLHRKTGVVYLKHGNKLNLTVKEWPSQDTRGVPEAEARLISDGTRMERCLLRRGTEVVAEQMNAKPLAGSLADWFLHAGNLSSWPAVVDLGAREPIRDLKHEAPAPRAHVLSYTAGPVSITLWYDPTTYKVLRRIMRSKAIGTVTESLEEYEFNEDMADSLFVLAKDK